MKKRIIAILLLSVMMVCLITPFISNLEQNNLLINTVVLNVTKNIPNKKAVVVENPKLDIQRKLNNYIDSEIEKMNSELNIIELIKDKKEWFIAYKKLINCYSSVLDSPETIYDYYTAEELDLLFRVMQAEAGDEYSFEAKVNVASIIFNRLMSDKYSGNMFAVLVEDQFQSIEDGRYKEVVVSENTILACEYAFTVENTGQGCLFFDSNNTLKYNYVFSDEAHNFYSL